MCNNMGYCVHGLLCHWPDKALRNDVCYPSLTLVLTPQRPVVQGIFYGYMLACIRIPFPMIVQSQVLQQGIYIYNLNYASL